MLWKTARALILFAMTNVLPYIFKHENKNMSGQKVKVGLQIQILTLNTRALTDERKQNMET
jgi:hypothetical protein